MWLNENSTPRLCNIKHETFKYSTLPVENTITNAGLIATALQK